jgi:hypothetical protein
MCRRWIKGLLPLLCAGICSCRFADLRPIAVYTVPAEADSLLPGSYTPVMAVFDTPMETVHTERAFSVGTEGGKVEGVFEWAGTTLCFTPRAGWSPGTRYTLSLSGTLISQDGRELQAAAHVPFFAVSKSPVPYLESFDPPDGASVGINPEEGGRLRLIFSQPMDRRSAEEAVTLEGVGAKKYLWTEDDRCLEISAAVPLAPWNVYRWSVNEKALSREGVPLAKTVSAQFTTNLDRLLPSVVRVFPVIRSAAGTWLDTGDSLETGFRNGLAVEASGIGVEFNKPMNGESVLRAVRLDPALAGRIEVLSDFSIVFIPERDLEPETPYTLIVSGETRDSSGLKLGADYTLSFIPDIPFLRLLSLTVYEETPITGAGLENGAFHQVPVDVLSGWDAVGVLKFVLWFSLPFTQEAKADTAFRVVLDAYFPGTLVSTPVLGMAKWLSDDKLLMEWEKVKPGTSGSSSYYRLFLPGGRNGVVNGTGSFFKEDRYLYLEAVEP